MSFSGNATTHRDQRISYRKALPMKLNKKIATATLTIALAFGGATVASATGDGSGAGGGHNGHTVAELCANKDSIVTRLTERQTNLTARIAKLTEAKQRATDAGHAELAAKIDKRIVRLNEKLAHVTDRIAKAPAWIAAHCS